MSIIFVTTENFVPKRYGGTVATYNYFKAVHTPDTILASYYDKNDTDRNEALDNIRRDFKIGQIGLIPSEIRIRNSFPMLFKTAVTAIVRLYPYLAAKFFTTGMIRAVTGYVKKEKPEILYIDHMNLAFLSKYVKKISKDTRVVLINHNNEYELVAECAERENGLYRIVLGLESFLIDLYQARHLKYIDDIRCISFIDADNLNRRYRTNKFSYFPMPYFFDRAYRFNDIETNSAGMCGSLSWPLTVEGLRWYIDNVHPFLCKRVKGYSFHLAGSGAGKGLGEYLAGLENVRYYGYVEDIRKFYEKCELMVVPSMSGSGIRVKILEAFSMGVPVVATGKAVRGLKVVNGVHLLYDDDPARFADNVAKLLGDRNLRETLSRNAYDYLKEVHGPR